MRQRPLLAIAASIVVLIGVAAAVALYRAGRPPLPPATAAFGELAPEVRDLVNETRQGVIDDPSDAYRWGRYAMACQANGLVAPARDAYATAAALDRSNAKWWFLRASTQARIGQVDEAVHDMRRAIDIDPAYAPAYWRLGLWLLDLNQVPPAEQAFERATQLDASDRAGWIGLARATLLRGDAARAADQLERLAAGGAPDPYTLQLLGTAYRQMGRADQAATALAAGAKGEAQWGDRWTDEMLSYRRGYAALLKDATAYIVAGQFEPAIRILEQLRRDKPGDPVLLAHLGQVYVAAGQDAQGIPLLERVVAEEPGRFEAWVDLATGYMHQDHVDRARTAVERAIAINQTYAPAYETLGLVRWRGGDMRGAVAALNEAASRDPRNARAFVWMGMVLTNSDRPADAVSAFERAVRIDPTNVDAWIGIANGEMNRHDLRAAAAALDNARRLQPNRPAVQETVKRLQSLGAAVDGR